MRHALPVLLAALAVSPRAEAALDHVFHGWSADGSFYGVEASAGGALAGFELCLSNADSASWPAGAAKPAAGACVDVCADEEDNDACQGKAEELGKLLRAPKASKAGPHGETVAFAQKAATITITIAAPGKPPVVRTQAAPEGLEKGSKINSATWRPDGGAVALHVSRPPAFDMDDMIPGFVVVALLDAKTAVPQGDRAAAQAANSRGMAAYKAKDWASAMKAFREAIAADDSHVLAHYNLACTASLAGEKGAAVEQLEWLAKSADPDAKKRVEKGKTDPDLAPIRGDARVRQLLGL